MQCPICRNALSKIAIYGIEIDSCSNCVGAWFDPNELANYLRKSTEKKTVRIPKKIPRNQLRVKRRIRQRGFCPKCNQLITPVELGSSGMSALKCVRCGGMWVYLSHMNALRYWYGQASLPERLELYGRPQRSSVDFSAGPVWKSFFGLMEDENPRRNFPWTTLIIIITNISIFILSYFSPVKARFFLMVPENLVHSPSENIYTLYTSMFMHANLPHILGNMYFLWVFGDNIEDRLGTLKYIFLYFSCGIIAGLAHIFITSRPEIPVLGASGAISGILGGYLLLYPKARIKLFSMIFFRPIAITLPIWFYLGVWFFGQQVLYASMGVPGIAWYAHIGGFIFGFIVLLGMKKFRYL